ncbi:MAG: hypothetical protein UU96_C0014G0005 [Parcubacteria group bacterium GW2011_GWC2_42_13]|nr:MAG: hypothetical protein UU96_C0014G0005 [Parcubacteria group bacterium GW2011_GWC2_42_13]
MLFSALNLEKECKKTEFQLKPKGEVQWQKKQQNDGGFGRFFRN